MKNRALAAKAWLMFGFLAVFVLSVSAGIARADQSLLDSQTGLSDISQVYGTNTPTDIRSTIAMLIDIVLGFLGTIFIVLTIFAGFKYMTSGGNEEKAQEAMALLRNAVIGLIIVLAAWAVTRVVVIVLGRAVNNAVDPWTGL